MGETPWKTHIAVQNAKETLNSHRGFWTHKVLRFVYIQNSIHPPDVGW
jgi:hypothetical protein